MSEVWEHCGGRSDIIGCLWKKKKKQLISNKCCCTSHREFVPRATGSTDTHISLRCNRCTPKPHEVTNKQHLCIYTHTNNKNPHVLFKIFTLSMSRIQSTSMIDGSGWEWHASPNSKRVKYVFYEKHTAWNRWCRHWSGRPNSVFLMGSWTLFALEKWKRTANDVLLHDETCQWDSQWQW